MPAEWEPQSATWLSWPSNTALWPGHYDLIPAKFAEFAAAISRFQPVKINAAGKLRAEAERELKAAKADNWGAGEEPRQGTGENGLQGAKKRAMDSGEMAPKAVLRTWARSS